MAVVSIVITSLENYLGHLREHTGQFGVKAVPWFRGEPDVEAPLLPRVYRPKPDGTSHDENQLLQMFRMKAPSFAQDIAPNREDTDQWLFLAQHVGLPTRLLDWSESALLALYFALKAERPVVWMIDPFRLNELSITAKPDIDEDARLRYPLTWFDPRGTVRNIGIENIKGAWERNYDGLDLPVAVHPTYIHPRMSAQRSVFTVHGAKRDPIPDLIPNHLLRKFMIDKEFVSHLLSDLHMLGINDSTAFPDLDGLASELTGMY